MEVLGDVQVHREAARTQSRALTVLRNDALLPLERQRRVHLMGIDPDAAAPYAEVVGVEGAEVALVRLRTPYDERSGTFESFFRAGRLHYTDEELAPVLELARSVPTVVVVNLERPAILTPLAEEAAALVVDFGACDAAVLAALFGDVPPEGRLPFDLPRTRESVESQHSDAPFDLADPLFRFGDGLGYERNDI